MPSTELCAAYITLIPSLKGAQKTIESQLAGVDTATAGRAMGSSIASGLSSSLKGASSAIGGVLGSIGGAVGSLAASGGMARALNLEQAQTMFKGLKLEWDDYYDTIDKAVTGTAFSLDQAALVAASLAASGVSAGDEMSRALNACTGMAATFGGDLGDIGTIFQKVAAKGKLSGDELLQLSERGINATSVLSEHLGIAAEDVSEMVSAGEIDFKTFSDAMYAAFGDAASNANNTFTGSLANMRSALSRIGADFATPLKDSCIPVFNALRGAINAVRSALSPAADAFGELASQVSDGLVGRIEALTAALEGGGSLIDGFKAALGPVGGVVATAAGALAGLGAVLGALGGALSFIPGLGTLVGALGGGAAAAGVMSGATGALTSALGALGGAVKAAAGAAAPVLKSLPVAGQAFSVLAGKAHLLSSAVTLCGGGFKGVATVLGGTLLGPVGVAVGAVAALAAAFGYLMATDEGFASQMSGIGAQLSSALLPALSQVGSALAQMASAVLPVVAQLVTTLAPVISMVATAVLQLVAALAPLVAQLLATVLPVVAQVIALVTQVAAVVISAIMPVIAQIVAVISANMPIIQSIVTTVMNAIMTVVQAVWPFIQSVISVAMSVIQTVISAVMAIIQGDWQGAWEIVKSALESAWEGIKSGVQSGIDAVMGFVSEIPGKITGFFADAGSWLLDAGSNIIHGLWDGISGALGWLGDQLGGIGSFIAEHKGPREYDLKLLVPNGGWIMQSLAEGMERGLPVVRRALEGITEEVGGFTVDAPSVSALSASAQVAPAGAAQQVSNYYISMDGLTVGGEDAERFGEQAVALWRRYRRLEAT